MLCCAFVIFRLLVVVNTLKMACEGGDEASVNASTRQMQIVGSTFVVVENDEIYYFGVQAPVQHFPSPITHLIQR